MTALPAPSAGRQAHQEAPAIEAKGVGNMPGIIPPAWKREIPRRYCWDCPFKCRISGEEAAELFGDYPFDDPERPMLCHMAGEFEPGPEHLCKGFYTQAKRNGYSLGVHVETDR
jgi:hypothetical protein